MIPFDCLPHKNSIITIGIWRFDMNLEKIYAEEDLFSGEIILWEKRNNRKKLREFIENDCIFWYFQ